MCCSVACSAAGLGPLVEWNTRRELDIKVAELQEGLTGMMEADPPHNVNDIISYVKTRKTEQVRGCCQQEGTALPETSWHGHWASSSSSSTRGDDSVCGDVVMELSLLQVATAGWVFTAGFD